MSKWADVRSRGKHPYSIWLPFSSDNSCHVILWSLDIKERGITATTSTVD